MHTAPALGQVRFLRTPETCGLELASWVSNTVFGRDQSVRQWARIIQDYTRTSQYFPFLREPAAQLTDAVAREFRVRACVQKFIRNVRMRVFRRRIVGEVDLYTTAPIPPEARVRVHDYASKSVYVFHTQTAIRIILSALQQSIYGIPTPHIPKNPYTNLPFSFAQMITIMGQIWTNCAACHRIPPRRLLHFRECMYDVKVFKSVHNHALNIESATALLHAFDDPMSIAFYMEILDDTVDSENLAMQRWSVLRLHFMDRSLPVELRERADALVLSLFLFQNHGICYGFRSYTAMLDEFVRVYRAALNWWKHRPRQIIQRLGPVAFSGGGGGGSV